MNAALIGVVLLCLTPVFRHMPLNALAAIVITGVIGLLDFPRVLFLLKVSLWLLSSLLLGRSTRLVHPTGAVCNAANVGKPSSLPGLPCSE